ncbi:MAG TPA: hypothetical protein PLI07_02805, partial [Candidatus Hydrogenedentes bacterium]|nr:hypothetical protein [Candidatus Hydrogenedentota bacterium]
MTKFHCFCPVFACLLVLGLAALWGGATAHADPYESSGVLLDLVAMEGETITIDTGITPPTLVIDSFPISYLYRGRVDTGVAVFDFNNVYIDRN